ncbi:cytochrome b561 domain-containing protein [Labrenzia sp. CE80]|uniref:cytochrome b561 domain-containing protein n=1 Tax=Labrenzia sp. CE80 TaxID=1788986 RepID=UPI00129AB2A5|nr:cytochrome b561 domain-containing protein [Labrenzia sp. CE80]
MHENAPHIPTEVYLGFLGRTIDIHWNYHAMLMFFVWIVLVPICVTVMRFHKPPPSEKGLQRDVSLWHREWWFFSVHKYGLLFAMFLAVSGTCVALVVSGGFSQSTHSYLGMMTVLMGVGQVISSQMRGTRGGKYREGSDINDPKTWQGDQYSRTPKRRLFEAYHKTSGYFTILVAFGAVGSGLMQYNMPILTLVFFLFVFIGLAAWVIYEFKGRSYDGYRVAHGYGLEHPYNKEREFL